MPIFHLSRGTKRPRAFSFGSNTMNPRWVFLILSLLPLVFPSWAPGKTSQGRVIKVFDGDTFLVRVHGREEHVRLRGIDAPEISKRKQTGQEPWAKKAREFRNADFGIRNYKNANPFEIPKSEITLPPVCATIPPLSASC